MISGNFMTYALESGCENTKDFSLLQFLPTFCHASLVPGVAPAHHRGYQGAGGLLQDDLLLSCYRKVSSGPTGFESQHPAIYSYTRVQVIEEG